MNKLIGFFADGLPFDGDTIRYRSLGGSETAVYYMAKELCLLGNEVRVICNCENPGTYGGVQYVDKRNFKYVALTTDFDVFVVSRFYSFFQIPFRSRLNVLWNHDILTDKFGLLKYLPGIDAFFNLSNFHSNDYVSKIPALKPKIWQTRNGIDLETVNRSVIGIQKKPNKMIYASRPERGLQILLETIWPRLLKDFPDLELYMCGYSIGTTDLPAEIKELYVHINQLIKVTPKVFHLGNLSKSEYYNHLAESQLMLYPCDFPEISCIVALEAQACRTPIVTTNDFALRETVGVKEWLIEGKAAGAGYQDGFVNKVKELLTNQALYRETVQTGYHWVESRYTWRTIAQEWDRWFNGQLEGGHTSVQKTLRCESNTCTNRVKHSQSVLRKNLDVLAESAPRLARQIEDYIPPKEIQVVSARSGLPVLRNHIAMHSLIDPQREARNWADRMEISELVRSQRKIAVFGFGMGYHINALLDFSCPSVIVIEPDLAVLRVAFEWIDFSKLLEKITLVSGDEQDPDLVNLYLVPHQPTVHLHKPFYRLWKKKIELATYPRETISDVIEAFEDNEEIVQFLRNFASDEPADIDKLVAKIPRGRGQMKKWQTVFFLMKELRDR